MDYGELEGQTLPGYIDRGALYQQFDTFSHSIKLRAGKQTMTDYWSKVLTNPRQSKPMEAFATLARIALSFPIGSVENERSFSMMNTIKTAKRSRVGSDTLNCLCRIKRCSYTIDTFPYNAAVQKWKVQKDRRGVGL